jgi:arylsulfatase A-like enzyme
LNPDVRGEDQNAFIKEMLEKYRGDKLFLFIHYFDVHSATHKLPYEAPPPYNTLFSKDYCGNFKGGTGTTFASKYLSYINKHQITLAPDDIACITALYDNGIAYADKCVGDVIALLKQEKRFDNSLIVITADHGEEFQEHGYLLHDNPYYYEEIVRVPLILKLPDKKRNVVRSHQGNTVDALVESIDIMPTILDIIDSDGPRMQGMSLLKVIDGDGTRKECVFAFGSHGNLMVRTERWKLINDRGFQEDRFKLFDVHNDPMEHVNLIGKGLASEARLKEKLKEKMELSFALKKEITGQGVVSPGSGKDDGTVSLTREEKERLKALGYVK